MEWSVNCMFPKSLTVLNSRCANKQSCSVLATTSMFGDPCPGTHKYLEAHYQCVSSLQTSTTSNRPSPPPWVLSNNPPQLPNGSSLIPAMLPPSMQPAVPPRFPLPSNGINNGVIATGTHFNAEILNQMSSTKSNYNTTGIKMPIRHDIIPPPLSPPPPIHHHHHTTGHHLLTAEFESEASNNNRGENTKSTTILTNTTLSPNIRILDGGVGVNGNGGGGGGTMLTMKTVIRGQPERSDSLLPHGSDVGIPSFTTSITTGGTAFNVTSLDANLNVSMGAAHDGVGGSSHIMNNIHVNTVLDGEEDSNIFCPPTNARNLFWNLTKVGDINVQPCPGGATGIAKWRCVLMKRMALTDDNDDAIDGSKRSLVCNSTGCESLKVNIKPRYFEPSWHPITPDLTQCRSLWLNNLEVRVNQRDSSLISIANDLSEVTSSKTLYGGDMLVTTKIIQIMSEKMFHDKETFPDQRLREAMILELLQGVVKTGSNLLDESQLSSWLDLNQEDQMRVATSLLTGLEDNAFLLADTIIRERNVVQKVKNILLSIRVLETKNIQNNEIFPDGEQWHISDDRIELPRLALLENSEGGLVRIVFAAFDRLESILRPSYDHFDLKNSKAYVHSTSGVGNGNGNGNSTDETNHLQQRLRILNSKVISASLGKGRHIQLSQPIKLILRHLKTENVTNPTCVFWNYIDHTWSANGCMLESSNRTHSICMCNHLTNFAILMDIMNEHSKSLFTMFDGNMRILIYISTSICILFIVIALLTLKIFNGVFIKVRSPHNRSLSHRRRSTVEGSRRHNNVIDQTHESIAITNTTQLMSTNNNSNSNSNSNMQHQFNLQNFPAHTNLNANNFIQHNNNTSICNPNRNNLNANNYNLQQQQQQHVVTATAAAVVVANNNQHNMPISNLNNLNLNLNLQSTSSSNHHNFHYSHDNNFNTSNQMETSMAANTSAAAVAAAATIAAALQQHAGVGTVANHTISNGGIDSVGGIGSIVAGNTNGNGNGNGNGGASSNININSRNNQNLNNSDRTNSIIMQSNIDDFQYKWWWW